MGHILVPKITLRFQACTLYPRTKGLKQCGTLILHRNTFWNLTTDGVSPAARFWTVDEREIGSDNVDNENCCGSVAYTDTTKDKCHSGIRQADVTSQT